MTDRLTDTHTHTQRHAHHRPTGLTDPRVHSSTSLKPRLSPKKGAHVHDTFRTLLHLPRPPSLRCCCVYCLLARCFAVSLFEHAPSGSSLLPLFHQVCCAVASQGFALPAIYALSCLCVCHHCDVDDFRCVTKTITMTKTMIMYLCLAQVPNTANINSGGVALGITQAPPQEICDG